MSCKHPLPTPLSPVCIIWRDAHDGDAGLEELDTLVERATYATVHTTGFLVGKNDEVHVLMQDYCSNPSAVGGFRGHYMIPNECIIRVIPFEEKLPTPRKRKKRATPPEPPPTVSQENGWAYATDPGIPVSKEMYEAAAREGAIMRKKAIENIENPIFGDTSCTGTTPSSPSDSASSTSSGGCGDSPAAD